MNYRPLAGIATSAAAIVGLGILSGAAPAHAAPSGNPSAQCSSSGNGGIDSHGGCTSSAARFGSADLGDLPYLSNSAFVSNCKSLPEMFAEMVAPENGGPPLEAYPLTFPISNVTVTSPADLANYVFHDIFGPDMSTCVAILAADHATIANPGPDGPYDVYYTGGHGRSTTFSPGVPPDLAAVGFGE